MSTILCVCGQSEDIRSLQISLQTVGHELTVAPDRFRAAEMMVDRSFDAAVLFLGTSPRDIWELIPLLGRLDPKLPILTVAEEDSVETQREIRRLRVFYHLTQPVDVEELRQALEEALAHRGAQR